MSARAMGLWSALVLFCLAAGPAAAAPKVVVSIKPVHSLVAGVMRDLGSPVLLISGSGSPHGYSMRPSEARALSEADLVFWVGSGLEASLAKPLAVLTGGRAQVITLSQAKGVRLLQARAGGTWEAPEETHGHDDDTDVLGAGERPAERDQLPELPLRRGTDRLDTRESERPLPADRSRPAAWPTAWRCLRGWSPRSSRCRARWCR